MIILMWEQYRHHSIIICTGQGSWEDDMIRSTSRLKELLDYKDVPAWIDFWGYDVNHDWPWWARAVPLFFRSFIIERNGKDERSLFIS